MPMPMISTSGYIAIRWYQHNTHGGRSITSLKNKLPAIENNANTHAAYGSNPLTGEDLSTVGPALCIRKLNHCFGEFCQFVIRSFRVFEEGLNLAGRLASSEKIASAFEGIAYLSDYRPLVLGRREAFYLLDLFRRSCT